MCGAAAQVWRVFRSWGSVGSLLASTWAEERSMTDSPDRPITSPDFLDQPVLVTPNHIVRVKENEALSGNGNESAASQSFERSLLLLSLIHISEPTRLLSISY